MPDPLNLMNDIKRWDENINNFIDDFKDENTTKLYLEKLLKQKNEIKSRNHSKGDIMMSHNKIKSLLRYYLINRNDVLKKVHVINPINDAVFTFCSNNFWSYEGSLITKYTFSVDKDNNNICDVTKYPICNIGYFLPLFNNIN